MRIGYQYIQVCIRSRSAKKIFMTLPLATLNPTRSLHILMYDNKLSPVSPLPFSP
ncbi:hypothetical protein CPter91_2209 [Collimonas pratensis]|uniref:Uncharacterized protein n=1 Tax=Collimonas pratensis TaxID=279113 RepID=A0A127Q423_9BURK|nr:hypothetical protein CPter91_2209 [Collimonas pratensis]